MRWPGLDRLLLPGGISGTQLGPARPGSHPQPPSPVSLGGVVILKRGLIFVVVGKKSTFVSEKKVAVVSFLLCTRIPWPRGRLQRLEIHKTQIWAVLQLIADMGSAGQAAMSSAKVRICMCVCVGTDGGGLSTARDCKGRLV